MLRKTLSLAVAATVVSASFATAEEHVILYLGDAFFPQVTYVDAGDELKFVNSSNEAMNVISADSAWSIGPIAVEGSETVNVTAAMALEFIDADSIGNDSDGNEETFVVKGDISFDEPILE